MSDPNDLYGRIGTPKVSSLDQDISDRGDNIKKILKKGVRSILDVGTDLGRELFGSAAQTTQTKSVSVWTMEEALEFFADFCPRDSSAASGILIRERKTHGWLVAHLFQDAEGHLCVDVDGHTYGKTVFAQRLDMELSTLFGDDHMVTIDLDQGDAK